jgi:hypothetical protein
MSLGPRWALWVVRLMAVALAAAVLAVASTAAAPAKGLAFAVKIPPAGSVSWLFVRLQGTLKPGATPPMRLDLRQLAAVKNAAALPKGLAVYAAARVGRSGSTIAIREQPPADTPPALEFPDLIIAPTPQSVAPVDAGSYDGGPTFGWKAKGSPAGSTNAAAVVNDLDAIVTEVGHGQDELRDLPRLGEERNP